MPVLPNDPAIPLWVLNTVPRSQNRAGYASAIGVNAVLALVLIGVSAYNMYTGRADTQWLLVWFIFLLGGLNSLNEAGRAFLGRRWLDRHQQWGALENLKWAAVDEELPRTWSWFIFIVVCGLILLAWQFLVPK